MINLRRYEYDLHRVDYKRCTVVDSLHILILNHKEAKDFVNDDYIHPLVVYVSNYLTINEVLTKVKDCKSNGFYTTAGIVRGKVDVSKNETILFDSQLDELYSKDLNPLKYYQGRYYLWGEQVLNTCVKSVSSYFNYVHVLDTLNRSLEYTQYSSRMRPASVIDDTLSLLIADGIIDDYRKDNGVIYVTLNPMERVRFTYDQLRQRMIDD